MRSQNGRPTRVASASPSCETISNFTGSAPRTSKRCAHTPESDIPSSVVNSMMA